MFDLVWTAVVCGWRGSWAPTARSWLQSWKSVRLRALIFLNFWPGIHF